MTTSDIEQRTARTVPARALRRTSVIGLVLAMLVTAASAREGAAAELAEAHVESLVRLGDKEPAAASRRLAAMVQDADTPALRQRALLGLGIVQAQSGQFAKAEETAQELALAVRDRGRSAQAGPRIVRALAAWTQGRSDIAAIYAQAAFSELSASCPSPESTDATQPMRAGECDHRSLWRIQHLLAQREIAIGALPQAQERANHAALLARRHEDVLLETRALGMVSTTQALRDDCNGARQTVSQAQAGVARSVDAVLHAQVKLDEAQAQLLCGDAAAALRASEQALRLLDGSAHPSGVLALLHLAHAHLLLGRPADSLDTLLRASKAPPEARPAPLQRRLDDIEGLASIASGRAQHGRRLLERNLQAWEVAGETGHAASALRDHGAALAKAGDPHGALALYHQERRITEALVQKDRETVLDQMRRSHDLLAKERTIALMRSENSLKAEALANADLLSRVRILVAVVIGLIALLAFIHYRRQQTDRDRLSADHDRLHKAAHLDALTGCANRRHFDSLVHSAWGAHGVDFRGALFLLDIDHFKSVNDRHGHAAGDAVLVEVARRLRAATRESDMVVRWGGEEFLVVSSSLALRQAEHLAARILHGIGSEPFRVGDTSLRVTASMGYACIPIPPDTRSRAMADHIALIDAALYAAKNGGRNRAVGLSSVNVQDREELAAVCKLLSRAAEKGQVTLRTTLGPAEVPDAPPAPAAPDMAAALTAE